MAVFAVLCHYCTVLKDRAVVDSVRLFAPHSTNDSTVSTMLQYFVTMALWEIIVLLSAIISAVWLVVLFFSTLSLWHCQSGPGCWIGTWVRHLRSALGRAERQSGMGISQKTETRCHNFSFFKRKRFFENVDGRKTRNCGSALQIFGEMPIHDWRSARPKALLKCRTEVPIRRPGPDWLCGKYCTVRLLARHSSYDSNFSTFFQYLVSMGEVQRYDWSKPRFPVFAQHNFLRKSKLYTLTFKLWIYNPQIWTPNPTP